jgi:hypothetical protein
MFKKKGEDHAAFLNSLPQYLDGREVSIQNMVGFLLATSRLSSNDTSQWNVGATSHTFLDVA